MRPRVLAPFLLALILLPGGPTPPMLELAEAASAAPKTFAIPELNAPVTIRRDSYGIPHIEATNAHDCYVALGFVQAGDRLWQMDTTRRSAQGRLSEIGGPKTLDMDKWFRTLGISEVARQIIAEMDPETLALLEAYSSGVNRYMQEFPERREPEFLLIGYTPEPWTPYDSVCVMRMVSWWLSGDYEQEMTAWQLANLVGVEKAAALFPLLPDEATREVLRARYPIADGDPGTLSPGTASAGYVPEAPVKQRRDVGPAPFELIPPPGPPSADNGTNVWVIAGSRTASGTPILANDPHLQLFAPSVWYEAHLKCPEFNVTGFAFPGLPAIAIGHNEHIAWGASNYPADSQDLFVETLSADSRRYRTGPGDEDWASLDVRTESIPVRESMDTETGLPVMHTEELPVYRTSRGPVVSVNGNGTALSLAWKGLEPSQEITVFLNAAKATSVAEFQRSFEAYGSPTQNFYVFDRAGHIGAVHAGHIPQRARPDAGFPRDPQDPANAWEGEIPYAALAQVSDPIEGFLANANNKPVECDWATGARFTPPLRYRRIRDLITARTDWTPEDTAAMQMDTVNLGAIEALEFVRAYAVDEWSTPADRELWGRLMTWDGDQRSDEVATTLWYLFSAALSQSLIEPVAGAAGWARLRDFHDPQYTHLMSWVRNPEAWTLSEWSDEVEPATRLRLAFEGALERGRREFGPDPSEWRWPTIHQSLFAHPSGIAAPGFGAGSLPQPGGRFCINVGNFTPSEGWNSVHGVSLRYVAYIDDSGRVASRAVLPPGNAGASGSPNFANQLPLYERGELRAMPFYAEELESLRIAVQLTPSE